MEQKQQTWAMKQILTQQAIYREELQKNPQSGDSQQALTQYFEEEKRQRAHEQDMSLDARERLQSWRYADVKAQLDAFHADQFEVGFLTFTPLGKKENGTMMTLSKEDVLKRLGHFTALNAKEGYNINIRPVTETPRMTMVDDLDRAKIERGITMGYTPSIIIKSSHGNYQAWYDHGEPLTKELATVAAKQLAETLGGDPGAAAWKHFSRLATFQNRKPTRRNPDGSYQYTELTMATGEVYPGAKPFLQGCHMLLDEQHKKQKEIDEYWASQPEQARVTPQKLTSIEDFHKRSKYGNDRTLSDEAYAVYAARKGVSHAEIQQTIAISRGAEGMSKKGKMEGQLDYLKRTVDKAFKVVGRSR